MRGDRSALQEQSRISQEGYNNSRSHWKMGRAASAQSKNG